MRQAEPVASYLLVLSDREAIWWVLSRCRMAFPDGRAREASALEVGDRLMLYSTRGAWHNPTRDRGRVIGEATVSSPVARLDPPVHVAGRDFGMGCDLTIEGVAPYPSGVDLREIVPRLHAFPDPATWSTRLRRPLVPLDGHDARLLTSRLRRLLVPATEALAGYRDAARVNETSAR